MKPDTIVEGDAYEYWKIATDRVNGYFPDSTLYHLAGDSIVVNVLMAIFAEMIVRSCTKERIKNHENQLNRRRSEDYP